MIKLNFKNNSISLVTSLAVSALFIVILLLPNNLWYKLFIFLNVPAGGLDLADAKSIVNYSEIFKQNGFVDIEAVDFWNRKFSGISLIWKEIAILFKFYNSQNFYIFIFLSFSIYIFSILKIAFINITKLNFFITILFFFTTSSFYLIERGNFDLILFGIVTLLCFVKEKKYQLLIIVTLCFLKINLIFLFFILVKNIKTFLNYSLLASFIFFLNFKYIVAGYVEIGSSASITHYGIFPIIKSILHFFNKITILDVNKYTNLLGIFVLIIFSITALFFLVKELKKININSISLKFSLTENLFLAGSFFYILSFISFSAPDYKLVFLILSLPYLLNKKLFFLIFAIFAIMNSCVFESYPLFQNIFNGEDRIFADKNSIKYFLSGITIHLLKIFVFISLLTETISLYKKKLSTSNFV